MPNRSEARTSIPQRRSSLSFTAPLIILGFAGLACGVWAGSVWWSRLQSREKAEARLVEKIMSDPVIALDYATDQAIDGNIRAEVYKNIMQDIVMKNAEMHVLDLAIASARRLLANNGGVVANNASWFPMQIVISSDDASAKELSKTIAGKLPAIVGKEVIIVQQEQQFPWTESSIRCSSREICGDTADKIAEQVKLIPGLEKISNMTEKSVQNTSSDATLSAAEKRLLANKILDARRITIFVVGKKLSPSTNRPITNSGVPPKPGRTKPRVKD